MYRDGLHRCVKTLLLLCAKTYRIYAMNPRARYVFTFTSIRARGIPIETYFIYLYLGVRALPLYTTIYTVLKLDEEPYDVVAKRRETVFYERT